MSFHKNNSQFGYNALPIKYNFSENKNYVRLSVNWLIEPAVLKKRLHKNLYFE